MIDLQTLFQSVLDIDPSAALSKTSRFGVWQVGLFHGCAGPSEIISGETPESALDKALWLLQKVSPDVYRTLKREMYRLRCHTTGHSCLITNPCGCKNCNRYEAFEALFSTFDEWSKPCPTMTNYEA